MAWHGMTEHNQVRVSRVDMRSLIAVVTFNTGVLYLKILNMIGRKLDTLSPWSSNIWHGENGLHQFVYKYMVYESFSLVIERYINNEIYVVRN